MDPEASLSHVQWRSTEYILALGPLSSLNALDYFSHSPFFSKTSNNAVLRMQMMFSRGGMQGVDEETELRRFVGIEYSLVHAAPPDLFIIHKRDRKSLEESIPLAAYYILNSSIYQGPTLYTVLNERLLTSLHSLSASLNLLQSHKPKFTVESLGRWDIKPDTLTTLPNSASVEEVTEVKMDEGEKVEDDELERDPSQFNPLLFRAIQSASTTLSTPPAIIIPPPIPIEKVVEIEVKEVEVKEIIGTKKASTLGKRKQAVI